MGQPILELLNPLVKYFQNMCAYFESMWLPKGLTLLSVVDHSSNLNGLEISLQNLCKSFLFFGRRPVNHTRGPSEISERGHVTL